MSEPELPPGSRVQTPMHGPGTVLPLDGARQWPRHREQGLSVPVSLDRPTRYSQQRVLWYAPHELTPVLL